ncbi:imm11 family protein [Nocardioides sp. CPCC 206347]|uniref:imm11 family protein n=1 Tax=unclassified Nocardioides TaxID=2615069 RepID=UPI0036205CD3
MSGLSQIDKLYPTPDPDYPEFLPAHPKNAHIDWMAFMAYVEEGRPDQPSTYNFYLRAQGRVDAVWLNGIAQPLVSPALREVMHDVAGEDLDFLPVAVNEEPYWLMRVQTRIDALDPDASQFNRGSRGNIKTIQRAVWLSDRITDPKMFTIPQTPRSIWATPSVADAYRSSGCTGLNFGPYGEVV